MKWQFWRQKENDSRAPRVVFAVDKTGTIAVSIDWPCKDVLQEKVAVVEALARLIYYINDGQMLAMMQDAVAVAGHLKGESPMSHRILGRLGQLLLDGGHARNGDSEYVDPETVFLNKE